MAFNSSFMLRKVVVGGLLSAVCGLQILTACGVDVKKNLGKIQRVEIISIIADHPEAKPGDTVTLQATAVDPETWGQGNDQMVYYWVGFYPDAVTSLNLNIDLNTLNLSTLIGLLAQCTKNQVCQIGGEKSWTVRLPDRTIPEGKAVSYSVFLLAADSAVTLATALKAQDVTGKYDLAAKSVKVSEKTEANHNPIIQTITAPPAIQDASLVKFQVGPGEKVILTATAIDPDEGDTLSYRWWILKGRLEDDNLDRVQWTTPEDPGLYPVYLVVRDEVGEKPKEEPRGGQTIIELKFEVLRAMPGLP